MTLSSDLDLRSLEKLSQQLMDNGMKYRTSSNTPGEETKQCLKIFLELGHYLLERIIQEVEEGNTEEVEKEKTGDVETEQENTMIPPDSGTIATVARKSPTVSNMKQGRIWSTVMTSFLNTFSGVQNAPSK